MKLSELKQQLLESESIIFVQPNGHFVPTHFHVTEVGLTTKHSIDCGGAIHHEKVVTVQIWVDNDTDHRLVPQRFLQIISLSEKILGNEDLEVEVEYQTDTIGRYGLKKNGEQFLLVVKHTDCLAQTLCGINAPKHSRSLKSLIPNNATCCTSESGCC